MSSPESDWQKMITDARAERDAALAREAHLRAAFRDEIEDENGGTEVIDELRELWQRALEREGNLASAVADVIQKATQFGETESGDTYAYIVPKGAMHRLVGVAQQNGAHVSVAFRTALATDRPVVPSGRAQEDGEPTTPTGGTS